MFNIKYRCKFRSLKKILLKGEADMKKWEYRLTTIYVDLSGGPESALDSLGEQGWEAVSAIKTSESEIVILLKREIE